ncbi:MAG TPA: DUF3618 domain-containing protein [Gammaproteobacteria bacterium]|nr:DUF3618 domain-containing protein [Gammaproteobacteria bacterium]
MNNELNRGGRYDSTSMDPAGRSPEEIEQEIRQTRSQMDNTLDAIQQRLSPGYLMDEAFRYLRYGGGNEFVHNFNESIKRNPVPMALMGVSLAWLMMSGREGRYAPDRAESSHLGERLGGIASRLGSAASTGREKLAGARESISSTGGGMGERAGQASDTLREQASHLRLSAREQASRLSEQASRLSDRARHSAERARGGFDTMLREQPLLLGALGIAVGAALGALIPPTREEDELMGEASDRLTREAKQQAHLQLRKGKKIAEAAGEAASHAAEDQARRQQGGEQQQPQAGQQVPPAEQVSRQSVPPTPGL